MIAASLFASEVDGALWRTDAPDWSDGRPVRNRYMAPKSGAGYDLQDVKACLRAGPRTRLGAYPLFFVMTDGAALSFEGARQAFRQIVAEYLADSSTGWRVDCVAVNWEDSDLRCDHTGELIPSAYGAD